MFLQRHDFTLAVNAGGAATVFSAEVASGLIRQITYTPDGSNPLDTGADLVITGEVSGLPIATLTNIGTVATSWAPRQAVSSVAGAPALFAAGGTALLDRIAITGERIKVVVAQGGNAKLGTLSIVVG